MKRRLLTCIATLLVLSVLLTVVGCAVPQATFEASVTSGTALLKVDFTNKTSTGMFKKADEFRWDFGDGGTMTTKTIKDPVSHDFTKAATFTVTLTVVKNGKTAKTTTMSLTIDVAHGLLDHVQLSPKTIDLDIGQSQQFTTSVVDAYGNQISEAKLTWTAADGAGSISQDGALSGGTKAGNYGQGVTVTAALDNISKQDSASVTIKPDPLDIVTISPIVVPVGETKLLKTIPTDRYGNPLNDVTVTWSLINEDAGSITADGNFKAGEVANSYADAVEVQVKQGDVSRTAKATIQVTPGALDRVYVAPDPADIGIGMTQQFVAAGADKFGNRINNIEIDWSVINSGGTIDSKGLFTAGKTPGDYKDTIKAGATVAGVTQSATVDVTVEQDRIAFVSDRDNAKYTFDIYTMDINGNNQKRVTTSEVFPYRPASTPGGGLILFSNNTPDGGINTITLDGKWEFAVSSVKGLFEPALSPDGKKIAYMYWDGMQAEIYVMDADGGNPVRLTNDWHDDEEPAWSPDSKKIAFMSDREGNEEIYVMNADGSTLRRLTNNVVSDVLPQWSSDGSQILFQSETSSKWIIETMNSDGTNIKQVINTSYDCNYPAWSPDGTKIVFHSWQDYNQPEISIANADGSNITRLTNNQSYDGCPIWLPRKMGVLVAASSISIPFTGKFKAMSSQEITAKMGDAVVRIETDLGSGSGFIIDPSGLILTANHVVKNAQKITITLNGGQTYTGQVRARDLMHDLALIKISATGLPYFNIEDTPAIGLGQDVIILGYPLGSIKLTVTSGLISSINYDGGRNVTWIQTDSAINFGNSGGPMLDSRGRVIGIVDAKLVGVGIENVGYAISISTIDLYLAMLEAGQTVYQ